MPNTTIELGAELAELLQDRPLPLQETAKELTVLELYREGKISSGKAAALLGMTRLEFLEHASRLGIPYFDMSSEEWQEEVARICRQ